MKIAHLILAAFLICGSRAGAATIANGSFELPVIGGTVQFFDDGEEMAGWTVVSQSANTSDIVMILKNDYSEEGGALQFDSFDGFQHLDLSGPFNRGANGVEQSFATTPGTRYRITFYLGNQDNARGNYPLSSEVEAFIDGVSTGSFSHGVSTPNNLNWEDFSFEFRAAGASTTLTFINRTAAADNMTGLDNVSIEDVTAVPEPSAFGLIGGGAALLLFLKRKR